jgi:hypothetical protein
VRSLLAAFVLTLTLLLAAPELAGAAPSTASNAPTTYGYAIELVRSATIPPPGFSSNANQAIAAAKATPAMQAIHRREHPLQITPAVWVYPPAHWFIDFSYRGKVVAEVDVSPKGRVEGVWTGAAAITPYAHGNYSPLFDAWWVVVPFAVMFVLPFLDPRRLRRILHLDALVVLSFLVSYALFEHGRLDAAIWLVYPPLLYLLLRMLAIGVRGKANAARLAPLLSHRILCGGLLLLIGARIALTLISSQLVDVGLASVVGAHRISAGQSLYYASLSHGDTYGPVAYLAYLPLGSLIGWHAHFAYIWIARGTTVIFDLVTIAALVLLGRRLKGGEEGRRLGYVLGWAWAACPLTLFAVILHTNDGLVAMLSVLSLLAFTSPAARGALLGLAAAAKFSPAALLPLYAGRERKGLKGSIICVAAFAGIVALAVGLYLPRGGIREFYDHTIGYQLGRSDVFSPWGLHPGLAPLQKIVEILAVLFAAAVAFVPRERSLGRVCALAAAVTIAIQLPATHWFYYYIIWFAPFVIVALLGRQPVPAEVRVTASVERSSPAPYVSREPIGVEA